LAKFLAKCNCSTFVVSWELVSNHGLIRLKRFVSSISSKLCNQFYFLSIFNASCIRPKIRRDGESTVLLQIFLHLNWALVWKSLCHCLLAALYIMPLPVPTYWLAASLLVTTSRQRAWISSQPECRTRDQGGYCDLLSSRLPCDLHARRVVRVCLVLMHLRPADKHT
jgi:hypothetical protein